MKIDQLISDFSPEALILFFRQKLSSFKPEHEDYSYLFDGADEINDNYKEINKLGEADLENADDLLVLTAKTLAPLTDKTGKKRQFEIAKKILKEENKDAAFFIIYDEKRKFRFSFIRVNFSGSKRSYTDFRRYTYFVDPEKANKTFKQQISKANFTKLDSILEAFNVEPVTREFYIRLQHWYFWALNNVKFPDDAEEEPHGREIAVIRLITRIMFIWFMRVRGLIPEELFDKEKIEALLWDTSPEVSTYYQAVLQNLFFATLNTPQKNRKFRNPKRFGKGYNSDFGNHNVYRYYDLIKNADLLESVFRNIPFLNGGLFECLDYKSKEKEERKYIDGFTGTKSQRPSVPNFLFFSEPENADLSRFLNGQNNHYEVQGLIQLLNNYNFTIDENDPDDVEVALDPELLGSIFENLLASYNPETATTARKATGSFYTPPEVVNFMTNESLKAYFKENLSAVPIANLDTKLHNLLTVNNAENPFDEKVSRKIITLINDLRIVDPAVGSGAFPMAVLNKLVFILGKLDPDNRIWKESQINSVEQAVDDPVLKKALVTNVEKRFEGKNADYGRKLFLIEKCIYGVDIQQIAVEIAKLRFFISLLVDETIDFDHPENNYGIETLPNLDFKLMQGDSLISRYKGIDFSRKIDKEALFDVDQNYNALISRFEELKNRYQNESDKQTKDDLRMQIDKMVLHIFEEKLHDKYPLLKSIEDRAALLPVEKQREAYREAEKRKLTQKLGFDIIEWEKELLAYTEGRKPKQFFLWDVYFAEVFSQKKGFDIVIGNPPYIQLQKATGQKTGQKFADLYKSENYLTFERTGDIYALFYEKGLRILNSKGILAYITSNKWMRAAYGASLREFLSELNPLKIIDMGPGVFNAATVDTNILLVSNQKVKDNSLKALTLKNKNRLNSLADEDYLTLNQLSGKSWIILSHEEQNIKEKIEKNGTPLKDWDIDIYRGVLTGYNQAFIIDGKTKDELIAKDHKSAEIIKPVLRGRDIKRYKAEFADLWLIATFPALHLNIDDYPAVKSYLGQFLPKIKQTGETYIDENGNLQKTRKRTGNKWFETQDQIGYWQEFEKEKIIYPNMTKFLPFVYDEDIHYFHNDKSFHITGELLYWQVSFFNSSLFKFVFKDRFPELQGGTRELRKVFFQELPVLKIQGLQERPFKKLVEIIKSKKEQCEDTKAEEQQIDLMVYKLYDLSYDEVKVVDPEFEMSREAFEKYTLPV